MQPVLAHSKAAVPHVRKLMVQAGKEASVPAGLRVFGSRMSLLIGVTVSSMAFSRNTASYCDAQLRASRALMINAP